jgi:hypothetical protein
MAVSAPLSDLVVDANAFGWSSDSGGSHSGTRVGDNDGATYWETDGPGPGEWLWVDLESDVTVSGCRLVLFPDIQYVANPVVLEATSDATHMPGTPESAHWTQAMSIETDAADTGPLTIPAPVTGRWWRIRATGGAETAWRVSTFSLFGAGAGTPPAPASPASGTHVRRPVMQVYIDGLQLIHVLGVTTARGLAQELATCDITVPYPCPAFVKHFSHVQVLIGVEPSFLNAPHTGLVERFVGYVINPGQQLWPGQLVIHCEDTLALAKYSYTAEEMDLSGDDDSTAVRRILQGCGYPDSLLDIGAGTGKALGDVDEANLRWELGQTGLEKIQEIDSVSLGWRTWATVGGRIQRTKISTNPNTQTQLWWFNEGVDVLEGSASSEIKDAKNEITVSGWDGNAKTDPLDESVDPFDWHTNSYWVRFLFLKAQAASAGRLSAKEVAEYILSQLQQMIVTVNFSTHLDTLFQGTEVIGLTSKRLEVSQRFWVQSVQLEVSSEGTFTQTITAISTLQDFNRRSVQPPTSPTPGAPLVPPAQDVMLPPSATSIMVRFSVVAIDKELAAQASEPASTGYAVFIVTASDQSTSMQGTIVSQQWTAGGDVVGPLSGSGQTFTTGFRSLTGATLTLSVTDSNGQTAQATQAAYSGAQPVRSRALFACTDSTFEAYDGQVWRSETAPGGAAQVVAAGPYWGYGNSVAVSRDYLKTPSSKNAALPPGEDVTAIWVHERRGGYAAVGGSFGHIAVTHDYGATWTLKGSPGAPAITHIIVSIFNSNEIHITNSAGWFKSQDEGATWLPVREGSFLYLELAPAHNIVVTTGGQLQQAETGTPFTGNDVPIVAATAHIRRDVFYALGNDGSTWYSRTGQFVLDRGEPIPLGVPSPAGMYRDGQVVDLVYFCAGPDGLWKTMDGFRSPRGYLRLRQLGRLTP